MFTKNVFLQPDAIAELVKPMLETQLQQKIKELEELLPENSPFDWKKPREPEVKGGGGAKKGRAYGGSNQEYDKPEDDTDKDEKNKGKNKNSKDLENVFSNWSKNNLPENSPFDWKKPREPEVRGGGGVKKGRAYGGANQKDDGGETATKGPENAKPLTAKLGTIWTKRDAVTEAENAEHLDELSKSTLGSYIKHAASSAKTHGSISTGLKTVNRMRTDGESDELKRSAAVSDKKSMKRLKGVFKATDKLVAKESVDDQLDERSLSSCETKEKENIVKGMKKNWSDFKSRYGDKAKSVMYATATKAAKKD